MYTLGDYERIVTIKTLIFDINLNFLHLDDLKKIAETAYDLGIEKFPKYDLDDLCYDDPRIELVYKNYKKWVINEFECISNELNGKMN